MQVLPESGLSSASSVVTPPLAFDNDAQVVEVIDRIKSEIDKNAVQVTKGKSPAFVAELQSLLDEIVKDAFPSMIKNNVSLGQMSWEAYESFKTQSHQPVDAELLGEAIKTQNSAFHMSSAISVKRVGKPRQLSSQVSGRVERVLSSASTKASLLDTQRKGRKGRQTILNQEVDQLPDLSRIMHQAEEQIQRAEAKPGQIRSSAERAHLVFNDVQELASSNRPDS